MSEWFPERQLTQKEAEQVFTLLGGLPPQPEWVEFFLMGTADTAFKEATRLKTSLDAIGQSCAAVLDVPPNIGATFFMNGALFYARVFQEMYPFASGVPCEDEAFGKLISLDDHAFTWEVSERLETELPSYCSLFDVAAPALHVETGKERTLALIGSGAVHAVAADSLRLKTLFEDIEDSFNGIEL